MNKEILKHLLKNFGVETESIGDMQTGYRNKSFKITSTDKKELNLIIFKSEQNILEKIERADKVSEIVAKNGFPTRKRYSNKTARLRSPMGRIIYARLYEYLPGETIPWEAYTKKHIKLLGQAMSDIHYSTKNFDIELSSVVSECKSINSAMKSYFDKYGIRSALGAKLSLIINPKIFDMFDKAFEHADKLSDQIPLHLDLVRGNILYGNSSSPWKTGGLSLTGVIDFEKTARGNAIFDLARTYAFLLVDCSHKTPEDIYKYLVHSGYNKRGKNKIDLSGDLSKIFYLLVRFYLFYDFYKFLLHNPYESLSENHHYKLTRDILLQKNMLKSL